MPTGSAADLCKMAMTHIFAAVAASRTLTARSVRAWLAWRVHLPFPGLGCGLGGACCSLAGLQVHTPGFPPAVAVGHDSDEATTLQAQGPL